MWRGMHKVGCGSWWWPWWWREVASSDVKAQVTWQDAKRREVREGRKRRRREINARGICEEFTLEIRKEIERKLRSKPQDFTD